MSNRDAMYVIYIATIHTVESTVWIWHTLSYIVYGSSWQHWNHYHYLVWYHVALRLLPHHLQFLRRKQKNSIRNGRLKVNWWFARGVVFSKLHFISRLIHSDLQLKNVGLCPRAIRNGTHDSTEILRSGIESESDLKRFLIQSYHPIVLRTCWHSTSSGFHSCFKF